MAAPGPQGRRNAAGPSRAGKVPQGDIAWGWQCEDRHSGRGLVGAQLPSGSELAVPSAAVSQERGRRGGQGGPMSRTSVGQADGEAGALSLHGHYAPSYPAASTPLPPSMQAPGWLVTRAMSPLPSPCPQPLRFPSCTNSPSQPETVSSSAPPDAQGRGRESRPKEQTQPTTSQ